MMNDVKKDFRKKALNINKNITDKLEKSNIICDKLSHLIKDFSSIGIYAATPDEVNLDNLIHALLNNDIKVALPKMDNNNLSFYYITSLDKLIVDNKYGIREPKNDNLADKNELDAIIIPGVAFDINLNRMGHGKGYYDKYLEDFKGIKIGVCFGELLFDNIPTDTHDIKMDMIITNEKRFAK